MNSDEYIHCLVEKKLATFLPLLNRPLPTDSNVLSRRSLFKDHGRKLFWQISENNKIATLLADSYMQCGDGINIPERYARDFDKQAKKITLYLEELNKIGELFIENELPIIILENGGIAYAIYRNSGCYSFGDFDLILDLRQFKHAHEKLLEIGFDVLTSPCLENSTSFNLTTGRVEYVKSFDNNLILRLNLQPTLVARKWFFTNSEPDFKSLLYRSIGFSGHTVRILGREDFLFQLCIHNASHGYIRKPGIRLHLDIDWYVRSVHNEIDWPTFIQLVHQMRVKNMAYFSLLIPKIILETPIPDDVVAALKPARWKERMILITLKKGDLLAPEKRQFTKAGFLLFNILIHDSIKEFLRAFIPSRSCLTERYGLMQQQSRFMFLCKHYIQAAFGK